MKKPVIFRLRLFIFFQFLKLSKAILKLFYVTQQKLLKKFQLDCFRQWRRFLQSLKYQNIIELFFSNRYDTYFTVRWEELVYSIHMYLRVFT